MCAWVRVDTMAVDTEMPIDTATLRNIVNNAVASLCIRFGMV